MSLNLRTLRKRGQATIIGNLLILSASVAMATVVLFWALSFQGEAQASYSSAIFQSNAQSSEQVSIDEVRFWCDPACQSGSTNYTTIYVRNFGDIPIKIPQIYVNGNPYNPPEKTVVARAAEDVTVVFNWTSEETYIIRVATERGNQYERSFRAP